MARRGERGFTLLEVIIALMVIAVALAAVISTASSTVYNAAGLQERTFAHWVAMNKLAEIHAMKEWPAPRKTTGSEMMAEHEWHWTMEVENTDDETVRRIEIQVRSNEDDANPTVNLTGFIGRPT
jgi:general secretion pathway protein I